MLDESEIPYNNPALQKAYRRGWTAWGEGQLRPKRKNLGGRLWASAWLDGYLDAEDAEDGGAEKSDTEDSTSPSFNDRNPYSDQDDRLRQAWKQGYYAGKKGEPLPEPHNEAQEDPAVKRASLEGYQAALERRRTRQKEEG
jgi:hypothetical protein